VCRRQLIDVSLSSMFLTLYPSSFLSVKKSIKIYIFLKIAARALLLLKVLEIGLMPLK
jgi:hypothetical protein